MDCSNCVLLAGLATAGTLRRRSINEKAQTTLMKVSIGFGISVTLLRCLVLSAQIPQSHVDAFIGHPRVIVVSDIGNEPDDQMSLVRLLLYSNEIDIEGLVAATSTWQKTTVHPETMRALIRAYGEVGRICCCMPRGGHRLRNSQNRVYSGQAGYGMAATGAGPLSEGAQAIIRAAGP